MAQHPQQHEAKQSPQHPPGIWKRSRTSLRAIQIHKARIMDPTLGKMSSRKDSSKAHLYGIMPRRDEICANATQGQHVVMRQFGTQCVKQSQNPASHLPVVNSPDALFPSAWSALGSSTAMA
ncbi:hypothetical protein GQ600_6163 [Phytophthora cactorum]|nr:hypothetical protein GQ600_6163 [Phytophthora cactorum]